MKRALAVYVVACFAALGWWYAKREPVAEAPLRQHQACASLDKRFTAAETQRLRRALDGAFRDGPITVMGFRVWRLNETAAGLDRTGRRLVAHDGAVLAASECGDDQGAYYFIPAIARSLGKQPASLLSWSLLWLLTTSAVVAAAFTWSLLEHAPVRVYAVAAMAALTVLTWRIGDMYVLQTSLVLLLAPFAVWLLRIERHFAAVVAAVALAGAICATGNFLRSHSGTMPLLVIFITCLLRLSRQRRFLVATVLLASFVGVSAFFRSEVRERDRFLSDSLPNFEGTYGGHAFWHTVYLSLGFIPNQVVPAPHDESSAEAVRAIDAKVTYLSARYEAILKEQTLKILRDHPEIVAANVALKSLMLLALCAVIGHLGWVAAANNPDWRLHAMFAPSFALGAVIGIATVPHPRYLLGLIALVITYSALNADAQWESLTSLWRGKNPELARAHAHS